jgi:hypothetical protein
VAYSLGIGKRKGLEMARKCLVCREEKRVVSIEYYANGLYGYYCLECDEKEGAK